MDNVGLVLEGGGMRGLYTAGLLEYFMEKDLFFPYVIGVSAGACMAASYLSRQAGRNRKVNIDLVSDPRYLSFRNFIRKREIFGMDFLFDDIPNKVVQFDFDTFLSGNEKFLIGTTDCRTGKPIYYNKHEHGNDILTIIRASSSLPFIAPIVEYDGKLLLDGGLTDPIPIKKSVTDGYKRNIVIMTKSEGYRKQPSRLTSVAKYIYRKHPKVARVLIEQYKVYNDTLNYIHSEQQKGNLYLIQPSVEVPVSRIERNQNRLTQLYELGYEDAKRHYNQLNKWIKQN